MSKLMTDSKVLMDLLFCGIETEDLPIVDNIETLKAATLSCAELRASFAWMDEDEIIQRLESINSALVDTWHKQLALYNDFKDLIDEHIKQANEGRPTCHPEAGIPM